jgi:hypothetical protein
MNTNPFFNNLKYKDKTLANIIPLKVKPTGFLNCYIPCLPYNMVF